MSRKHSLYIIYVSIIAVLLTYAPISAAAQDSSHMGLKTVVIDPGHGGKDPGGVSKDRKTYEKNLVLDIAKRFGQKIKEKYPDG